VQEAIAEYEVDLEWRTNAEALLPGLISYRDTLAPTLGLREQDDLTREQALFLAKCKSSHKDISLNF